MFNYYKNLFTFVSKFANVEGGTDSKDNKGNTEQDLGALRQEITEILDKTDYYDEQGYRDSKWNVKKKNDIIQYSIETLKDFKNLITEKSSGKKGEERFVVSYFDSTNSSTPPVIKAINEVPLPVEKITPSIELKQIPKQEEVIIPKVEKIIQSVEKKEEKKEEINEVELGKKVIPWKKANKVIEKIIKKSELVPDLNNFTKEQAITILEKYKDKPYSLNFWKKDEAYVLTLAIQYVLGIKTDAKFGGETKVAVKKFQKESKIKEDGAVGPKTINAMLEKLK